MTIKKPNTPVADAPATGGAAIADRFKLDLTDPSAQKAPTGKGAIFAVVAGVLALALAGILTFIIYHHWAFLQAA